MQKCVVIFGRAQRPPGVGHPAPWRAFARCCSVCSWMRSVAVATAPYSIWTSSPGVVPSQTTNRSARWRWRTFNHTEMSQCRDGSILAQKSGDFLTNSPFLRASLDSRREPAEKLLRETRAENELPVELEVFVGGSFSLTRASVSRKELLKKALER